MLYDKLKEYTESEVYPMHMPGHKRNPRHSGLRAAIPSGLPYDIDITEIYGFDDLQDPRSILKEAAELAETLYGSDKAFLLINGSTVGILSAIGAHAKRGDKVLVHSNCHRSVYNAIDLFGLSAASITPETDEATDILCSVSPAAIEKALDGDPAIKLVVVTSPTYEGVISDIRSISEVARSHGVPLIVDSAHGAHLGFSKEFPYSAVQEGADVVVMSLHKTLPALTQCSLLHVCSRFANTGEISRLLSVLQTSSPSYILMASIDTCLRVLNSDNEKLFSEYARNLECFDSEIKSLKNLTVLCHGSDAPHPGFYAFDPGKLVISAKKHTLSGQMLANALRKEYKIELERACENHAIAMTSVCDSPEGFSRLANALLSIDDSQCK